MRGGEGSIDIERGVMSLSIRWISSIAILVVIAHLTGCGAGKIANADANPPLIKHFTILVDPEVVTVDFTVSDAAENDWIATIHFSEDLGQSWAPVTPESLLDSEIMLSPPFLPIERSWDFRDDLSSIPQADILLEIRIADLEGDVATTRQSDPISIGESEAPAITEVLIPAGPVGGTVTVTGSVFDPDLDHISMTMDWSPTGSDPWYSATLGQDPIVIPPNDELKPTEFIINWDAQGDAPELISPFAKVRIHASDGGATSTFTSDYLALNTIRPGIDLITIGEIPEYMNGQEPYQSSGSNLVPFDLSVPMTGSRLSLEWSPGNGGSSINPAGLEVHSNVAIMGHSPGVNLAEYFSSTVEGAHWIFDQPSSLPTGSLTISAIIRDIRGNVSDIAEYEIEVRAGSSANRPFSVEDRWFIDFSRDHYQIGFMDDGSGNPEPFANSGADGIPDHRQDLYTVGLQSVMDPAESTVMDSYVQALRRN